MPEKRHQFPTTRWTFVLSAGADDTRREALTWLCENYWYPIYAYLRRRGQSLAAAEDLTQSFLASFLERRSMETADPARGRFRSYLLGALRNFLADSYDYDQAKRRGGGVEIRSYSFAAGEERYLRCPDSLSPEALYEQQWAFALVERVLHLMRAEHEAAGKAAVFEELKGFLTTDGDYTKAAVALGMQPGAVRVMVHRLRRRYRDLFTAEIAETVAEPQDVQDEIRHLIEVLSA